MPASPKKTGHGMVLNLTASALTAEVAEDCTLEHVMENEAAAAEHSDGYSSSGSSDVGSVSGDM